MDVDNIDGVVDDDNSDDDDDDDDDDLDKTIIYDHTLHSYL